MFISFEDKANSRACAIKILEELKEYERTHSFIERKIGNSTIKCRNEERFKEYEQAIKQPKQW